MTAKLMTAKPNDMNDLNKVRSVVSKIAAK